VVKVFPLEEYPCSAVFRAEVFALGERRRPTDIILQQCEILLFECAAVPALLVLGRDLFKDRGEISGT
jgi:hypothetical protein